MGCIYLEHDLQGKVLTEGYGSEYDIVHVWAEETMGSRVSLTPPPPDMPEPAYAAGGYR
ncbi:MAG: hypothetical protein KGL10_04575 [Alphaproteobacteria bacterium]|nr:hypothetical protein [Alphaproteobacteria bacterium]MDE2336564.1 hypothetical protein [Alphaproteobacteria bacterium]